MLKKISNALRLRAAHFGLWLLHRSGVAATFFAEWRWSIFHKAQAKGLHILPVHYYSPVPNTAVLDIDESVPRFSVIDDAERDACLDRLVGLMTPYRPEMAAIAARPDISGGRFSFHGAPYTPVEADALYGWIRTHRPKRIVEIGCGFTTLLMSEAVGDAMAADPGYACDYRCIEPYLPAYLTPTPAHVTEVLETPLQEVPQALFDSLEAGDLLFIDSTHVLAYGSDVVTEYLQILPRLKPGVVIHIHDIFLPYDYPDVWMRESLFFWNEQYLLAGMLQSGDRYRVILPLHQLWRERHAPLLEIAPHMAQHTIPPGAFWIEVA